MFFGNRLVGKGSYTASLLDMQQGPVLVMGRIHLMSSTEVGSDDGRLSDALIHIRANQSPYTKKRADFGRHTGNTHQNFGRINLSGNPQSPK
jgi:hypothetical protein